MKNLKSYEHITLALIREDMRFILSIVTFCEANNCYNYLISILPYLGMIVDQSKKWGDKVFKDDNKLPEMNPEEKEYYELMRENIKLWNTSPNTLDILFEDNFNKSKDFFKRTSSTVAQKLKIYNIYGVSVIRKDTQMIPISNTILSSAFVPKFTYDSLDPKYIRTMAIYSGKLAVYYLKDEIEEKGYIDYLKITARLKIEDYDYGSFVKSSFQKYKSEFVLFSLLNECYKVLYVINRAIDVITPTMLRISYIFYYYLCDNTESLNAYFNLNLDINTRWKNKDLRDSMAHYGLGKILRNDTDLNDIFGGITNKLLDISWRDVLIEIDNETMLFANQLITVLDDKEIVHKYTAWNRID